jgi:hypothetical protein
LICQARLASGVAGFLERQDRTAGARRARGREAPAARDHHVQAFDHAFAHVVADFDAVAGQRRTVRFADRGVAFGGDDACLLIVDELVGEQRARAVRYLDVAFRRHDAGVRVVGHLVGADQNFLGFLVVVARATGRCRLVGALDDRYEQGCCRC